MKNIIKTLSLEGYVKKESRDGYATALLARNDTLDGRGDVIQEYVNSDFLPENTRVNVATGVITSPKSLRGCGLIRHSGHLGIMIKQFRIRSKDGFNLFLDEIQG